MRSSACSAFQAQSHPSVPNKATEQNGALPLSYTYNHIGSLTPWKYIFKVVLLHLPVPLDPSFSPKSLSAFIVQKQNTNFGEIYHQ